jgi:hypothetical protein
MLLFVRCADDDVGQTVFIHESASSYLRVGKWHGAALCLSRDRPQPNKPDRVDEMRNRGRRPTDPQVARFVETARALGCDEDKAKFEAALGKIAAHKPTKRTQKKAAKSEGRVNPND